MPTLEEVQETVRGKLSPGEQLIEAVAGPIAGEAFNSIVALTSNGVRVITPSGGSAFAYSDVGGVSWAAAWARLNVDLRSPRKRIVLAVFGTEWKVRAKNLAEAAKTRIPK
jgi:hypothetical protein